MLIFAHVQEPVSEISRSFGIVMERWAVLESCVVTKQQQTVGDLDEICAH